MFENLIRWDYFYVKVELVVKLIERSKSGAKVYCQWKNTYVKDNNSYIQPWLLKTGIDAKLSDEEIADLINKEPFKFLY